MKRLCILLAAVAFLMPLPRVFSMPIEDVEVQIVDTNNGTSEPLLAKMNSSMKVVAEQLLVGRDTETTQASINDYSRLFMEIGDRVFTGYELQDVSLTVNSKTNIIVSLHPWTATIVNPKVDFQFSGLHPATVAMLKKRLPNLERELVNTIAGDDLYHIDSGQIIFNGIDITKENATTRALLGIFLGAQNVPEIPGLTLLSFLKHSMLAHKHFNTGKDLSMGEFLEKLENARNELNIPKDWLNRYVNVGFSGGERKRIMLLRLLLTEPKLAILDEPDSGADKDVQQQIIDTINKMKNTTFLFISHQDAFSDKIKISHTTTLDNGEIVIK